ncbi:unnamed protein product [Parnassius apollo]|uniref:(apollo) hypothetical protein n=1 Tax=Parnassius apollo TaxID=110799 RepID=A0A8S3W5Q4_PARAO|nr:unnamed protein product [Parnassius apollo]
MNTEKIFPKLCKACENNKMASIPPSAFSAGRIRETQRNMKLSNINKGNPSPKYFNNNVTELTPLKYNSKLMNSIWGFYNRYSPHNVKKVNDAISFNVELQQPAVNSSTKNEPKPWYYRGISKNQPGTSKCEVLEMTLKD